MIHQEWLDKQQLMALRKINESEVPQATSFWCGYLSALNRVQEQHDVL